MFYKVCIYLSDSFAWNSRTHVKLKEMHVIDWVLEIRSGPTELEFLWEGSKDCICKALQMIPLAAMAEISVLYPTYAG